MFGYSAAIVDRFPMIRGGVIFVQGLVNGPSPPDLVELYGQEQAAVAGALAGQSLAELPSIAAWRRAFSAFGVKPTQYRNAAEALLRRLTKKGDIPPINLVVDVANLISIRHALPVAVFDQSPVSGATLVQFAGGGEWFTDLGADSAVHPEPGEVIFSDDADLVSARRWCWRQSSQSAASARTAEALITIEGHHDGAGADVEAATGGIVQLLARYQPDATVTTALLSPALPDFSPDRP